MKLSVGSVGNAVQGLDGETDFGVIGGEHVVAIEFGFDRVEHVASVPFVTSDQANEVAVAVEHCPDAGDFGEGRFAGAASHRQREQTTANHSFLDLRDDLQVVRRP
ncbi:hypothetical protein [Crateriforma conspicua]|uniref:hypothetical protein n=1 Tax=Crateriforma conspicua TaxID=2527996 RepID=UPI0013FD0546|nr:hypothetical protein [Crateriforma conspicua]